MSSIPEYEKNRGLRIFFVNFVFRETDKYFNSQHFIQLSYNFHTTSGGALGSKCVTTRFSLHSETDEGCGVYNSFCADIGTDDRYDILLISAQSLDPYHRDLLTYHVQTYRASNLKFDSDDNLLIDLCWYDEDAKACQKSYGTATVKKYSSYDDVLVHTENGTSLNSTVLWHSKLEFMYEGPCA